MYFETWLKNDLKKPVKVVPIHGNVFSADNMANLIGVEITDGGYPAEISGNVLAYIIREDGATVVEQGTLVGNRASVILPASAYAVVGAITIAIKIGTVTVGACTGYVYRTTTDTVIDPGEVIPDISELLDKIHDMEVATAAANEAATLANTKAALADEKATLADTKAGLANTAADNADAKAALANNAAANADTKATLADEKATLADTKARLANTAAENANSKAALADEKATLANTAAGNANAKADLADEKAQLADTKATLANTAAENADDKAALADTAAGNANTKAGLADTVATLANTKAELADEKATLADQKATLANTAAQNADAKAALANTAAARAEDAAVALEDMTVDAETLTPATTASVAVSEVDDHYHIHFGIPKGNKGDDATIVEQITQYQVSTNGTEVPIGEWLNTIPNVPQGSFLWIKRTLVWYDEITTVMYIPSRMGIDGSGSVVSVLGVSPDADGDVATLPVVMNSDRGVAGGVAELDANGLVPSSQLPSYVDDVLEYATLADFPATGESGKIYVTLDTNKTYRWSGTTYTEISQGVSLGETSSTAYRGDRGAEAYAHAVTNKGIAVSGFNKITSNAEGHVTGGAPVSKADLTALGVADADAVVAKAQGVENAGKFLVVGSTGNVDLLEVLNASGGEF